MSPSNKCSFCGAKLGARASACEYCGAEVALPPGSTPEAPRADFAALEAHPDYAHLITLDRPGTRERSDVFKFALFMSVFVAFSAFLTWSSRGQNGLPHPAPVLFTLLALLLFFKSLRRMLAKLSEPVQAMAAYVAELAIDDEDRNSAMLEFRDGRRKLCSLSGRVARTMAKGDMGIAYFRGDGLLDFQRL